MNKNLNIIFMGTPIFGKNVLEKLIDEYNVILVITQPDKRGKRGSDLIESPVKKLALLNNLDIYQPDDIKSDEAYEYIKKYKADFIVTAAYGQFIPKRILELPKYTILNVHGSLLPKYRGGAPIQRAIMNGDEYLGVSIMHTILKMDAGKVYKQSLVKLEDDDTTDSMFEKLSIKGREDLVEVINNIVNGTETEPWSQKEKGEITYSSIITKDEELIDFNNTANEVHNKVRALYSNPLAKMNFKDTVFKIYKTKVVKSNSDALPGTILRNEGTLIIKCMENAIEILEIQAPGKNRLDIKSFMNGYKNSFKEGEMIKA